MRCIKTQKPITEHFCIMDGSEAQSVSEADASEFRGQIKTLQLGYLLGISSHTDAATDLILEVSDAKRALIAEVHRINVSNVGVFSLRQKGMTHAVKNVFQKAHQAVVIIGTIWPDRRLV